MPLGFLNPNLDTYMILLTWLLGHGSFLIHITKYVLRNLQIEFLQILGGNILSLASWIL